MNNDNTCTDLLIPMMLLDDFKLVNFGIRYLIDFTYNLLEDADRERAWKMVFYYEGKMLGSGFCQ